MKQEDGSLDIEIMEEDEILIKKPKPVSKKPPREPRKTSRDKLTRKGRKYEDDDEEEYEGRSSSRGDISSVVNAGVRVSSRTGRIIKRRKFDDEEEEPIESKESTPEEKTKKKRSSAEKAQALIREKSDDLIDVDEDYAKQDLQDETEKFTRPKRSTTQSQTKKETAKPKRSSNSLDQPAATSTPRTFTPFDDILLKDAVQKMQSFYKIAKRVPFSLKFTPAEIEDRWRALLYDPEVSAKAASEMIYIPKDPTKRVLWSPLEEEILRRETQTLGKVTGSIIVNFAQILEKYRSQFHPSRTPKSLESHYYRMKRNGSIDDEEEEEDIFEDVEESELEEDDEPFAIPQLDNFGLGQLAEHTPAPIIKEEEDDEYDYTDFFNDSEEEASQNTVPRTIEENAVIKPKEEQESMIVTESNQSKELAQVDKISPVSSNKGNEIAPTSSTILPVTLIDTNSTTTTATTTSATTTSKGLMNPAVIPLATQPKQTVKSEPPKELTLDTAKGMPPENMPFNLVEATAVIENLMFKTTTDRNTVRSKKKEYKKEEQLQQKNILRIEKEYERERERTKNILALIRGKNIRYEMKTKEVVIGRNSTQGSVDIDLSEENSSTKISRKQALIKLKSDGNFYIKNIGKRVIFVNGKPVESNQKRKLLDCSLVEICDIKFIFDVNKTFWNKIRRQLLKSENTHAQPVSSNYSAPANAPTQPLVAPPPTVLSAPSTAPHRTSQSPISLQIINKSADVVPTMTPTNTTITAIPTVITTTNITSSKEELSIDQPKQ